MEMEVDNEEQAYDPAYEFEVDSEEQAYDRAYEIEIDSDDEVDPVSGFTNYQKNENFRELVETLDYLDQKKRITEDWMEQQKTNILRWREWIDDFTILNEEIDSDHFRQNCVNAETLVRHLIYSIHTERTFDVKVYHIFLNTIRMICETVIELGDINKLMEKMSVS